MLGRGGFLACCRGAGVARVGFQGPPAAWRAAAALALVVALWMRERGRFGEEVEDVEDDEEEEEVVVFGHVGCAAMRAGAALRAAAACAAATAGRMEGISSGCRLGAGGWRGLATTWRPAGPIRLAAVGGGGAALGSPPSGFGWAGLLQCVRMYALASAGVKRLRGLHARAGGVWAWGFGGACGVRLWVIRRVQSAVGCWALRGASVWVAGCGGR